MAYKIILEPDAKTKYVPSEDKTENQAPILQILKLSGLYNGESIITSDRVNVQDRDTRAENLHITISKMVANGRVFLDGVSLDVGSTFTVADIAQNRVSYQHLGGITLLDSLWFRVSDGTNQVSGILPIEIAQPLPPDVHILYPYPEATLDSNFTHVLWSIDGILQSDVQELVWGDNLIQRNSVDSWGRTGSDQIVVHHPNRVKILSPTNGMQILGYATKVVWTMDGVAQTFDTLEVLSKGNNTIIRKFVRNGQLLGIDSVKVYSEGVSPSPKVYQPKLTQPIALSHYVNALTQGENAVQFDILPDAIVQRRSTIVRGFVESTTNVPLQGVVIRVLDQPGVGYTVTDSTGHYILVVNGGSSVTLDLQKKGYIGVQRQKTVDWNDWENFDDIVMTAFDTITTKVSFGSKEIQVAKSTGHNDGDGYREAQTMILPGTDACLVMPNGERLPVNDLTLRATELTVGSNGLKAMPADLPTQSAYTYATEFTADEAFGAKSIEFSRPVPVYVDNFLAIPVGTAVPSGWYDREHGLWVAADDGVAFGSRWDCDN